MCIILTGKEFAVKHGGKEGFELCAMPRSDPSFLFRMDFFLKATERNPWNSMPLVVFGLWWRQFFCVRVVLQHHLFDGGTGRMHEVFLPKAWVATAVLSGLTTLFASPNGLLLSYHSSLPGHLLLETEGGLLP